MPVLTISRELGSQGGDIAAQVAQLLGYPLMDKQQIGKLLLEYGYPDFGEVYNTPLSFWDRFDLRREERRESMVEMLNRVILALAQHGNIVLLGRGGYAVLAGYADVFNVRIQAPLALRIERVMAQQNLSDHEQAAAVVTDSDKVQTTFLDWFYRIPWDTIRAFDLVIDTGKVAPELATTWLVEAMQAFTARSKGDEPTTSTVQVDSVLASTVAKALTQPTL